MISTRFYLAVARRLLLVSPLVLAACQDPPQLHPTTPSLARFSEGEIRRFEEPVTRRVRVVRVPEDRSRIRSAEEGEGRVVRGGTIRQEPLYIPVPSVSERRQRSAVAPGFAMPQTAPSGYYAPQPSPQGRIVEVSDPYHLTEPSSITLPLYAMPMGGYVPAYPSPVPMAQPYVQTAPAIASTQPLSTGPERCDALGGADAPWEYDCQLAGGQRFLCTAAPQIPGQSALLSAEDHRRLGSLALDFSREAARRRTAIQGQVRLAALPSLVSVQCDAQRG